MKYLTGALVPTVALALAACGQQSSRDSTNKDQNAVAATAPAAALTPSERLLAAAEPFEKLTEIAFSAQLADIDKTIAEARSAVDSVKSLLPSDRSTGIARQFADIDRARIGEDRAGLALASIEIYRAIVSSVPSGTKVPSAVSLLDYAGFRYQADLKAAPIRWQDMNDALAFARTQWALAAPRLGKDPIAAKFEQTLVKMEKAAASKDAALAQSAVGEELDLVDKLEAYFSR